LKNNALGIVFGLTLSQYKSLFSITRGELQPNPLFEKTMMVSRQPKVDNLADEKMSLKNMELYFLILEEK
jgi:hypothetical protein